MKKGRGMLLFLVFIVFVLIEAMVGIPIAGKKREEVLQNTIEKYNPYDIKVISETGFLETEIEQLKELEGVEEIEIIQSEVMEVKDQKNFSFKIKVYSVPENINVPTVVEGNLPKENDECVIKKGESSLEIGDSFYMNIGGTDKRITITGIVSFPFALEEDEMINTIYFHKKAFLNRTKSACYIKTSAKDNNAMAAMVENKLNKVREETFESRKLEANKKIDAAKKALQETEVEIKKISEDEKRSLLAKQKALGKVELKIDQDEANRYDATQIAARRKELEAQKQSIAEKLGVYNDLYSGMKEEQEQAEEILQVAKKELELIVQTPIRVSQRTKNKDYAVFEKKLQEQADVVYFIPIFIMIITMIIGITGVNSSLGAKIMTISIAIAIILLINAFHYNTKGYTEGKLLITIAIVGTFLIFYFAMMAKMKTRIREITTNRRVQRYPKKIVMHLIWENYLLFIVATIFAVGFSIVVGLNYEPLQKGVWKNYLIAIVIASVAEILMNLKVRFELNKIA